LTSNTTGNLNTGLGASSLLSNTTGSGNTSVGGQSMFNNTTGGSNTAIGTMHYLQILMDFPILQQALHHSRKTPVDQIICLRVWSTQSQQNGKHEYGNSTNALNFNTTGNQNAAFGFMALYNDTAGSNVAIGPYASFLNRSI
jgi:hypothetical protein